MRTTLSSLLLYSSASDLNIVSGSGPYLVSGSGLYLISGPSPYVKSANSHHHCCCTALCCRTGTGPAGPRSTGPHSVVLGCCTPCKRTPPHSHRSWSSPAMVPRSSSRRPQPSMVKQNKHQAASMAVRAWGQSQPCRPDRCLCLWLWGHSTTHG